LKTLLITYSLEGVKIEYKAVTLHPENRKL
jgi:hypothetical protein